MKTRENRINSDPDICGGRPRIRNTRIRVIDVLELLSNGLSFDNILAELPDLEKDDIIASINYASQKVDHPVVS